MVHMREQLLRALLAHAQGDIAKHKANIEVYLEELNMNAKYEDQVEVIKKHFMGKT